MSVIKKPRLLVLDEPSSAIDALTPGVMPEFLKEVALRFTKFFSKIIFLRVAGTVSGGLWNTDKLT